MRNQTVKELIESLEDSLVIVELELKQATDPDGQIYLRSIYNKGQEAVQKARNELMNETIQSHYGLVDKLSKIKTEEEMAMESGTWQKK